MQSMEYIIRCSSYELMKILMEKYRTVTKSIKERVKAEFMENNNPSLPFLR